MKRSKSYTWLSGLLRPKPEEEWGSTWVTAEVLQDDSPPTTEFTHFMRPMAASIRSENDHYEEDHAIIDLMM
ncbi:unnamed protein product [Danaus chrysippus]|uniref:(African queen) hypothetical protein n=1 Tax=Danaus chrysippus TaxID=151541 RepID=A0A8J2QSI0_9NEOP|nr:unnamed protein product [Danaus chrysippus]